MITLTNHAEEKIKQHLSKHDSGIGIRVSVKTTGCSGLSYVLDYVEVATSTDIVLAQNGFVMFVDPKSVEYLTGTIIDYVQKDFGSKFSFINPNATDYCGCGESFTI
jgi:iron-sulfur cluster assembly protein